MCLHLAHGIEYDADNNQQAGAAEKLRCDDGNVHPLAKKTWQDRYYSQKDCAGECQPRHGEIKKIGSRFPRPNTGDIATIFFQIVSDLGGLKLRRDPEITEEENHRRESDVVRPAVGKLASDAVGNRAILKTVADDRRRKKKQSPGEDDRHHTG